MVTIEINNSYSRIINMTNETYKLVRQVLSYEPDPGARFRGGISYKRYLIDKKGFFPTGLLDRVTAHLFANGLSHPLTNPLTVIPKFKTPTKPANYIKWKGPKLYPDQITAFLKIMGDRGGAVMPTGSGKSLVIAKLASIGLKTLVIVPTLNLKEQLTRTLQDTLESTSHVTVENIDSPRLKDLSDFNALILDEVHHSASKTYQQLNKTAWAGIYYRWFLSATYFRNDPNEQLLFEAIAGKPVYHLTYQQAVDRGYIVPIEAYYIDVPKIETEAYTYQQYYKECVVHNEPRNDAVSLLMAYLANKSTLCLVKEIAHGNILSQDIRFVNGQDKESRQYLRAFNDGEIKQIVATTGIVGEGIDTKPCEFVIIAGGGKAKSAFMQMVGRCLRVYPGKESGKVILVRDNSHKFSRRHFKAMVEILKEEYGITPVRLEL